MPLPTLVEFLILGLACWRIAHILQEERGPFAVFVRLRGRIGIEHGEDDVPMAWPDSELGFLARCLYCGSVWVGFGMVGLYLLSPRVAVLLALPFAISAAAIVIGGITDGKSEH